MTNNGCGTLNNNEIWENDNSLLVFIKEPQSGFREAYWHYVVISKETGKFSAGDKSLDAKEELVKVHELSKVR